MNIPPLLLFPFPKHIEYQQDTLDSTNGFRLGAALPDSVHPRWLSIGLPEAIHASESLPVLKFEALPETEFPPEAFVLKIQPSGITISSADRSGFYYGLQTLAQIRRQSAVLPCLTLHDSPALATRGVMLDVSRTKVPRLEVLLERIAIFGRLRINQLQLYTEHTFAFPGHEAVWKDSSPLTPDDYRALDEACRFHCIELVPNLNSFGHMARWIKHPEYRHLAEHPGPFINHAGVERPHGGMFKPNRESADFMDSLYRDFLPCFTSEQFNIGCDETFELGQGWSKPLVEKEGAGVVYCRHLKRLHKRASSHSRIPQFWADIVLNHPEAIDQVPRPSIPVLWGYEANHPFEEQSAILRRTGLPFLVAPGTSSWLTLGTRWTNAHSNICRAVQVALDYGSDGILLTDWGDNGHHQPWLVSWPPIFLAAANAWSGSPPDEATLKAAMPGLLDWPAESPYPDLLLGLGKLDQFFSWKPHNSSPYFKLLMADPATLKDCRTHVSESELDNAEAALQKLVHQCDHTLDSLESRSLHLVFTLLKIAIQRGRGTAERQDLNSAIDAHRRLWLEENRPGGLDESISWLTSVLEWLDED